MLDSLSLTAFETPRHLVLVEGDAKEKRYAEHGDPSLKFERRQKGISDKIDWIPPLLCSFPYARVSPRLLAWDRGFRGYNYGLGLQIVPNPQRSPSPLFWSAPFENNEPLPVLQALRAMALLASLPCYFPSTPRDCIAAVTQGVTQTETWRKVIAPRLGFLCHKDDEALEPLLARALEEPPSPADAYTVAHRAQNVVNDYGERPEIALSL